VQLSGLAERVFPVLDRRLRRDADAPLAVALSGGGDSLALALLAADWAKDAGRRLLILTVDHGLRRESADWTRACAATARRLGAAFRALAWEDPKPGAGLAAVARAARHRLIAEAAREAGARAILMGHTASDVLEAGVMRGRGATTPDPKEWAPSPIWPEGRGFFLLRPLLAITRTEVRDWLTARGETWIDDPANADAASLRVQARGLTADATPREAPQAAIHPLAETARLDAAGGVHLGRQRLRNAAEAEAHALIGMACVCAGGGDQLPAGAKVSRIVGLLDGKERLVASLAGARVEADPHSVAVYREPGEAKRGGLTTLYLTPGLPRVWDGRFEFTADRPGLHVQRLEGLAGKLSRYAQDGLYKLPVGARAALPVVVEEGDVWCPALEEVPGVTGESLVGPRFLAACGLVEREPA
jgi:tRNA(Ile)-lysidine synthase